MFLSQILFLSKFSISNIRGSLLEADQNKQLKFPTKDHTFLKLTVHEVTLVDSLLIEHHYD